MKNEGYLHYVNRVDMVKRLFLLWLLVSKSCIVDTRISALVWQLLWNRHVNPTAQNPITQNSKTQQLINLKTYFQKLTNLPIIIPELLLSLHIRDRNT